ncbi:hypothetical protein EVAR_19587_1 [Eumeta japonica]|uniref:Uncharacterized protein n=1 Tax=Eumeta variegata TaxID=151549 RepID=A0A4C1UG62_EUMVA|nr:hypothetical protein EVAR_19587_1 [Eumeta japonica]
MKTDRRASARRPQPLVRCALPTEQKIVQSGRVRAALSCLRSGDSPAPAPARRPPPAAAPAPAPAARARRPGGGVIARYAGRRAVRSAKLHCLRYGDEHLGALEPACPPRARQIRAPPTCPEPRL